MRKRSERSMAAWSMRQISGERRTRAPCLDSVAGGRERRNAANQPTIERRSFNGARIRSDREPKLALKVFSLERRRQRRFCSNEQRSTTGKLQSGAVATVDRRTVARRVDRRSPVAQQHVNSSPRTTLTPRTANLASKPDRALKHARYATVHVRAANERR